MGGGRSAGRTTIRAGRRLFLGAPLPLADKVYVLSEMKGEIRLVALDAATGKLEWTQQLAVLETTLGTEQLRRAAGLCPSYADGVLVCPTAAGAVVALDLTTRSLLWGYQYSRSDASAPEVARLGMMRNPTLAANNTGVGNRWTDASVTIASGHVLLTPPESNQLHCLNLLDGKLLWQKSREDGIYVGCVHEDKVLVVGRNMVRALGLRDGPLLERAGDAAPRRQHSQRPRLLQRPPLPLASQHRGSLRHRHR